MAPHKIVVPISPGERQATTVTRGHPDAQVSGPELR